MSSSSISSTVEGPGARLAGICSRSIPRSVLASKEDTVTP